MYTSKSEYVPTTYQYASGIHKFIDLYGFKAVSHGATWVAARLKK